MTFGGKWRGNPFEGTADVGNVLSLRDLKDPFPLRLALRFARTSINAEGHVADIRNLSHIDAKVSMSGPESWVALSDAAIGAAGNAAVPRYRTLGSRRRGVYLHRLQRRDRKYRPGRRLAV